jgi:hypothetical protein
VLSFALGEARVDNLAMAYFTSNDEALRQAINQRIGISHPESAAEENLGWRLVLIGFLDTWAWPFRLDREPTREDRGQAPRELLIQLITGRQSIQRDPADKDKVIISSKPMPPTYQLTDLRAGTPARK